MIKPEAIKLEVISIINRMSDKINYKTWFNNNKQTLISSAHVPAEATAELKLLLEYLCDLPYSKFLICGEDEIKEENLKKLDEAVQKLLTGTPVDHIIGKRWFMGLEFEIDENTLIPRQETELLVEKAFNSVMADIATSDENAEYRILDLCTGSGCIIISLGKLLNDKLRPAEKVSPEIEYYASDISEKALKKASENAGKHGVHVKFIRSDMFEDIRKFSSDNRSYELPFDMIISNPPYISKAEMEKLDKKVSEHDPYAALYGGEDGLDFYRIIAEQAKNYLAPGGRLLLEIGYEQGESVKKLLEAQGYTNIEILKDYSGLDRVVTSRITNNSVKSN